MGQPGETRCPQNPSSGNILQLKAHACVFVCLYVSMLSDLSQTNSLKAERQGFKS